MPHSCKKEKKSKKWKKHCDSSSSSDSEDECCAKYYSCVKVKCGTISASLAITAAPTYYTAAGQIIVYSYTVTNTGTAPICYPITICDSRLGPCTFQCVNICPCGGTQTLLRPYTITEADLSSTSLTQTAYADIHVKCKKVVRTCPASVTVTYGSSDVSGTLSQQQLDLQVPTGTVTLTISNSPSSLTTAYGVSLTLPFPSGVSNVTAVSGSMTINSNNIIFSSATLDAGVTNTYVFTYQGTAGNSYQWAGTIAVNSYDTNLANNAVSSTLTLQ